MTHTKPATSATATAGWATIRQHAGDPAYQAFLILRGAFTVAPILFGADKFFQLLVDWDRYLAPSIANLSLFGVHQTMYIVGVIEIIAGVLVAAWPRLGAPVVSLWLIGIIANLLLIPGYYDVALRDFGLLLAALALARLAAAYDPRPMPWVRKRTI